MIDNAICSNSMLYKAAVVEFRPDHCNNISRKLNGLKEVLVNINKSENSIDIVVFPEDVIDIVSEVLKMVIR